MVEMELVSVRLNGDEVAIGERVVKVANRPRAYLLSQNSPNPFNAETTIRYDIAESGTVQLAVYALTGQLVRTLVNGEHPAGHYPLVWDGRDDTGQAVASGLYIYQMICGEFRASRKLVLLK